MIMSIYIYCWLFLPRIHRINSCRSRLSSRLLPRHICTRAATAHCFYVKINPRVLLLALGGEERRVRYDVFSPYLYPHNNSAQHNLSYEGWHNETRAGRDEGGGGGRWTFCQPPKLKGCQRILFAEGFWKGEVRVRRISMNLMDLFVSIYDLWIHFRD